MFSSADVLAETCNGSRNCRFLGNGKALVGLDRIESLCEW